jgi:hypothetical protein
LKAEAAARWHTRAGPLDLAHADEQNTARNLIHSKGVDAMKRHTIVGLSTAILLLNLLATPGTGRTQQSGPQQDEGVFYLGSFVLSLIYLPVKLATCVGTQAGAAVAYTATYGVPGDYDGNTNGKEIGEVARRSCTGPWIITSEQVKKDYGN